MNRFILVHRVFQDDEIPTWLNTNHITAMEAVHGGAHTRLYIGLEGCCVVSESVTAMLDAIRRTEDDR